jgi:hypothetical protein
MTQLTTLTRIGEIDLIDTNDPGLLAAYKDAFDESLMTIGSKEVSISIMHTLNYVRLLIQRNLPNDRTHAEEILSHFFTYQVKTPASLAGHIPVRTSNIGQKQHRDLNASSFIIPHLIRLYSESADDMSPPVRDGLLNCIRLTADALRRRWDYEIFDVVRDHKRYTNIFVEYIRGLYIAGELLGDEDFILKAEGEWTRWFNHTSYEGIDEFMSPRYAEIAVDGLLGLLEVARCDRMCGEIRQVLDMYMWINHASHHPRLGMPICGSSRDYRRYVVPGNGQVGFVGRAEFHGYPIPDEIQAEFQNRQFPFEFSGTSGMQPCRFKSWQTEDAGLGSSTGGNYFVQQNYCMAAVGKSATEREWMTMPYEDSLTNGFTHQIGNECFCVFGRYSNSYVRTQAKAADSVAENRKPLGPRESIWHAGFSVTTGWERIACTEEEIVFSAYGYTLTIYPFKLEDGQLKPVALDCFAARIPGQDKEMVSVEQYAFPDEIDWMGAHVVLSKESHPGRPEFQWSKDDSTVTFASDDAFSVNLFEIPTGDYRELYEGDPRTFPLFQTPDRCLWPGELSRT